MNTTEKLKKGQKIAGIATIATLFLALLKAIIGFFSGSIALIADATHSAADIVAIFASWSGLKIAQRKPNEKFNYGYYKAENIATLVVSLFIFYAGYKIFTESIDKFSTRTLNFAFVAMSVSLFSSLISYFIARYELKIGKEINSQSLIANAQESKLDILSSFVVFFGIAMTYIGIPYVEASVGILISLLIFKVAFENSKLSVYALMDAIPNKELLKDVKKIITSTQGVLGLANLKLRQSGPFVFGEATITISKSTDISKAHELCNRIEHKISEKHPEIESFVIHTEPIKKTDNIKVLVPVQDNNSLNSKTINHFGRSRYFLFAEIKSGKISRFYIKDNMAMKKKIRAGLSAAKQIKDENVDVVLTSRIGEISFHTLKDSLIEIYSLEGSTAKDAIMAFIKGKANEITSPTHESDK